jgi:tetratricopeptide (TPR) repeat protein
MGKFNPAISDLEQAIQLKPNLFDAYISLGRAYADNREVDRAMETWTKAIRLNPTDITKGKAFNELALHYTQNKNALRVALRLTEISLKYKPNEPTFLDTLAEIYYRMGDFKKAERENENARNYSKNDERLIRSIDERAQKIKNQIRWK